MPLSKPSKHSVHQSLETIGIRYTAKQELIVDQIRVMRHQEVESYSCCDNYTKNNQACGIDENWRRIICKWEFDLVDHFDHSRELVLLAMNYLDHFMSSNIQRGVAISKRIFQLAAVTCIYVASKIESGKKGERNGLSLSNLGQLSCGLFTIDTLELMEQEILSALSWRMNPPTATCFIVHFIQFFPECGYHDAVPGNTKAFIYRVATYLSELSVLWTSLFIERKPSIIAVASLIYAIECSGTASILQDVHNAFLKTILDVSQIRTESSDVQEVYIALKRECPSISKDEFEDGDVLFHDGSISPTCVLGQM
mmetsp:Transcript_16105/g.22096  ORF Transcript_16105/g.22096 Transcript_16105/m.22096 type:complete len:311 (-) Transcript_16105:88-1020(-)